MVSTKNSRGLQQSSGRGGFEGLLWEERKNISLVTDLGLLLSGLKKWMTDPCEVCGWLAALCAMLAFGSFGVPIKGEAARSVDIDPLVFQSYKTGMCLLTSWVVLLFAPKVVFTPWGIVSGLFWVPGGVATIYAVKAAGLAVGIGVGSSFIVLVSFIWGIFVFEEPVVSKLGACCAVLLMTTGICGMSYFSSPEASAPSRRDDERKNQAYSVVEDSSTESEPEVDVLEEVDPDNRTNVELHSSHPESSVFPNEGIVSLEESSLPFPKFRISRRTLGICAAVFNGTWGGSIMVPMHWAPPTAKGVGYVVSFAVGASIVTIAIWCFRFLLLALRLKSVRRAYGALPSFHIRTMWLAGGTSGTLWSIGNFFSMISVLYLGEGVGYSVIQAAMIVSGVWGIFYFKEVEGTGLRCKWFTSAFCTVSGILLLSYEHTGGSSGRR